MVFQEIENVVEAVALWSAMGLCVIAGTAPAWIRIAERVQRKRQRNRRTDPVHAPKR